MAMNEEIRVKPTLSKPMSVQSKTFEKNFNKTMTKTAPDIHLKEGESLNEVDGLLSEAEQSLKKKIFSLAKMEALVFSDPKLTSIYEGMAENGEEKYGYHYNETIQNMIFNDYVLNSPRYLQKYKMAIPKEKKRRDASGINQLKKAGEKKMTQSGLPKQPKKPEVTEGNEPLTKVMFLVNERDPENQDIFAYFPEEQYNEKYKSGYSHVGQHTGVHPEYAAESRQATPEEYADLKAELENQVGYNLEVLNGVQETTDAAGGGVGAYTPALGYEKRVVETTDSSSSGAYVGPAVWGSGDLMKTGGKSKAMSRPIWKGGKIIQESNYLTDPAGFQKYVMAINEQIDIEEPQVSQKPNVSSYTNRADNNKIIDKTAAFTSNTVKKWDKPDTKLELNTVNTGTVDEPNLNTMDEKAKSKKHQHHYHRFNGFNALGMGYSSHHDGDYNGDGGDGGGGDGGGMEENNEPNLDEMLSLHDAVEYLSDRNGENPFELGGIKWQFVNAKYPDGKTDIGVYRFGHDIVYDYARWREEMGIDGNNNTHIKEETQTMIQNNGTSMSNKPQPLGDQPSGLDMGMQSSGGLQENFSLLEELNNELNAYSIHHDKLKKMTEDRKPSSLVLRDRVGSENEKNFKKDLQFSGTKEIIDIEKELQWKDQQTDVGKDPQKLGQDIEKLEIKTADMKSGNALKNVGDSANDKGDEIPKRNLTTEEQEEVNMYRLGQQSWVYDNDPGKRFEDRMKADMGDKMYDIRNKQLKFRAKAPMYNKEAQPTEATGVNKAQFNKEKSGWNERDGIKESMITGRYHDALDKRKLIDFTINEVGVITADKLNEGLFELDFTGLGNTYNSKTVDNKVSVNESVINAISTHKFYTDGKKVFAIKNLVQKLNENEQKVKPVINEQMNKMKHLLGYKPETFTNTNNVKKNRGF